MAQPPPVELLKATHTFPCIYHVKAIGTNGDDFVARTIKLVRDELKLDKAPAYTTRETAGGRHVSVTIDVPATSAEQVHDLYKRLLDGHPGLILLL